MTRDEAIEAVFGIVHSRNVAETIVEAIWPPQPDETTDRERIVQAYYVVCEQLAREGLEPPQIGDTDLRTCAIARERLLRPAGRAGDGLLWSDGATVSPRPVLVTDEMLVAARVMMGAIRAALSVEGVGTGRAEASGEMATCLQPALSYFREWDALVSGEDG